MGSVLCLSVLTLLGLFCLVSYQKLEPKNSPATLEQEAYEIFSVQSDFERVFSPQDL
jgi:hypothetical protein